MEKQVEKENNRMSNQPNKQRWFEIDWTSSKNEILSSSLSKRLSKPSSNSSSDNETPPQDT